MSTHFNSASLLETLEARLLLSGSHVVQQATHLTGPSDALPAPELVPALSDVCWQDSPALPGDGGDSTVTISNTGNAAAEGQADISVYASANGTLDSSDFLVGSVAGQVIDLQPSDQFSLDVPLQLPGSIAGGSYYLITQVSSASIQESDPAGTAVADDGSNLTVALPILAGQFNDVTLPDNVVPGSKGSADVDVQNLGAVSAAGPVTVSVYASPDGTLGASDILLGSASQTVSLDSGNDTVLSIPLALPGSIATGDYYLVGSITSSIVQSDTSNNVFLADGTVTVQQPQVDLATSVDDFSLPLLDDGNVLGGVKGSADLTLTNNGNITAAGTIGVSLYASADGAFDSSSILLGSLNKAVSLQDGQSLAITAPFTLPSSLPAGDYDLIAVADTANKFNTPNGDNIGASDATFTVEAPSVSFSGDINTNLGDTTVAGTPAVTTTVTLTNDGNVKALGAVGISLYLSADPSLDAGSILVGKLLAKAVSVSPGNSASLNISTAVPTSVAAGDYYLLAAVDGSKLPNDTDPTPNVFVADGDYTVVAPQVDLTTSLDDFSLPQLDDGNTLAGAKGAADITLTNNGNTGGAGTIGISIYASADGSFDSSSILVGTLSKAVHLAPGQSASIVAPFTLSSSLAAGDYSLIAVADTANRFHTPNGDNVGVSDSTFTVEAPSVSLSDDISTNLGDTTVAGTPSVTTTVTLTNDGNVKALGAVGISLYLSADPTLDAGSILVGKAAGKLVSISPGNSSSLNISTAVPASVAAGDYYLLAAVDGSKLPNDTDPTPNVFVADGDYTVVAPQVDLTTSLDNFSLPQLDDGNVLAGTKGAADITLTNNGNTGGTGVIGISIYASADGSFDSSSILVGSVTKAVRLAAGQSSAVVAPFTLSSSLPAGDYDLIAVADTANKFHTPNGDNIGVNDSTFTIESPSVSLSGDISTNLGDTTVAGTPAVTTTVTLTNDGNVKALGAVGVSLYLSADPTLDSTSVLVGKAAGKLVSVSPGNSASLNINTAVPASVAAGDYYLLAAVDGSKLPNDTDPTPNVVLADGVYTVAAPQVDLATAVDDFCLPQLGDGNTLAGTKGTADLTLTNNGNTLGAGSIAISIYASANGVLDSSSVPVGSTTKLIRLQPGQSMSLSAPVALPSSLPAGDYTLIAVADTANKFNTPNGDNVGSSGSDFTVEAPAVSLSASLDSNLNETIQPGTASTACITLTNNGNVTALGRVAATFYLSSTPDLSSGGILIGSATGKALNLGSGSSVTVTAPIAVPASAAAGDYYLVASFDTSTLPGDSDPTPTVIVADGMYSVAPLNAGV